MAILQSSINWVFQQFWERIGDPYVYGGVYSPTNTSQGCDCSGCAGWALQAITGGPSAVTWTHVVSTESWPFNYNGNIPAAAGTVGPFGSVSCGGNNVASIPADAPVVICIYHGGGGEDSHMNVVVQGTILESNGGSDAMPNGGSCTNSDGGTPIGDSLWTDYWYVPGPVTADVTALVPVQPAAPLPVLYGVDVSNNNFGGPSTPNLTEIAPWIQSAVAGGGFSFVEAKASQGSTFVDPTFPTVASACKANNLVFIPYHFADTSAAASQVANFQAAAPGYGYVMIDFEYEDPTTGKPACTYAELTALISAFEAAGIKVVLNYFPQWYWGDLGSPDLSAISGTLVSSSWVSGSGYASDLYPGYTWAGWDAYGNGGTPVICQFTNSAQVGNLVVDANAFQGTLAELQALVAGTPLPVTPTPVEAAVLTNAQMQDIYNATLMTLQAVTGNLTPAIGPLLLPGSPTPVGADWGPQPNLVDQVVALTASVSALTATVNSVVSTLTGAQAGLEVLQKLAELQAILAGIPQNPVPTPTTGS